MSGAISKLRGTVDRLGTMIPTGNESHIEESWGDDVGYSDVEGDNSRWELITEDILENFEHSLKGERMNHKGEWYKPEQSIPKLNDIGVNDIMSDLRGVMHKGTYLGNIKNEYAMEETKAESKAFKNKLLKNLKNWKVQEPQIKSLVLSYARMIYLSFSRPVNDLERKHRNKRFSMKEQYKHDEVRPDEIKV